MEISDLRKERLLGKIHAEPMEIHVRGHFKLKAAIINGYLLGQSDLGTELQPAYSFDTADKTLVNMAVEVGDDGIVMGCVSDGGSVRVVCSSGARCFFCFEMVHDG